MDEITLVALIGLGLGAAYRWAGNPTLSWVMVGLSAHFLAVPSAEFALDAVDIIGPALFFLDRALMLGLAQRDAIRSTLWQAAALAMACLAFGGVLIVLYCGHGVSPAVPTLLGLGLTVVFAAHLRPLQNQNIALSNQNIALSNQKTALDLAVSVLRQRVKSLAATLAQQPTVAVSGEIELLRRDRGDTEAKPLGLLTPDVTGIWLRLRLASQAQRTGVLVTLMFGEGGTLLSGDLAQIQVVKGQAFLTRRLPLAPAELGDGFSFCLVTVYFIAADGAARVGQAYIGRLPSAVRPEGELVPEAVQMLGAVPVEALLDEDLIHAKEG